MDTEWEGWDGKLMKIHKSCEKVPHLFRLLMGEIKNAQSKLISSKYIQSVHLGSKQPIQGLVFLYNWKISKTNKWIRQEKYMKWHKNKKKYWNYIVKKLILPCFDELCMAVFAGRV